MSESLCDSSLFLSISMSDLARVPVDHLYPIDTNNCSRFYKMMDGWNGNSQTEKGCIDKICLNNCASADSEWDIIKFKIGQHRVKEEKKYSWFCMNNRQTLCSKGTFRLSSPSPVFMKWVISGLIANNWSEWMGWNGELWFTSTIF